MFLFFSDNQHLARREVPDLRLHRVLAIATVFLDSQFLFDLFEEQFALPAGFVEYFNCQRWQDKTVVLKDQGPAYLSARESSPPQVLCMVLGSIKAFKQHTLDANDTGHSIYRCDVNSLRAHGDFLTREKNPCARCIA